MAWEAILVALVAGMFGGFIREVYGNKGIFALPKKTEQNWALGGLTSIFCGLAAVVINLAVLGPDIAVPVAASLGIAWGIAFNDIVANAVAVTIQAK